LNLLVQAMSSRYCNPPAQLKQTPSMKKDLRASLSQGRPAFLSDFEALLPVAGRHQVVVGATQTLTVHILDKGTAIWTWQKSVCIEKRRGKFPRLDSFLKARLLVELDGLVAKRNLTMGRRPRERVRREVSFEGLTLRLELVDIVVGGEEEDEEETVIDWAQFRGKNNAGTNRASNTYLPTLQSVSEA